VRLFRAAIAAATLTGLVALGGLMAFPGTATATAATPTPPFNQCPAIGDDSGCALLVDVTDAGTQVLQDSTQGPYDGVDDTLLGVENDSSSPVTQVSLSSSTLPIFGFDGDGICTFSFTGDSYCDAAQQGGEDPYDYEGPNNTFSNISSDDMSGVVNFTTPLGSGQFTYFSLEDALQPSDITPPTSVTTSLSGGSQSGTSISVPSGTAVTDSAVLAGTNAATASGSVTYSVYLDSACTVAVSTGTAEPITTLGSLPDSSPVALSGTGTYYWQAAYSGDAANGASASPCGSEIETVTPASSTPTCTLDNVANGPPSALQFTAQDTGSGLATVKPKWHRNSTPNVASFTPGTTSPVTATFTKNVETKGGSASLTVTNESGSSIFCGAQFKTLGVARANSQGFAFSTFRNTLVIQNATSGLSSVTIDLNGSQSTVSLTPGEDYSQALPPASHGINHMVVEGFGASGASAVVTVWGVGGGGN
jgi:hypothetical protein